VTAILDDALAALSRWRQMNPSEPVPPVAVYLRDRERPVIFSALAVGPSAGAGVRANSSSGNRLPILVRDEDVERVVIGEFAERAGPGFRGG
jgi:hypothetical protein